MKFNLNLCLPVSILPVLPGLLFLHPGHHQELLWQQLPWQQCSCTFPFCQDSLPLPAFPQKAAKKGNKIKILTLNLILITTFQVLKLMKNIDEPVHSRIYRVYDLLNKLSWKGEGGQCFGGPFGV